MIYPVTYSIDKAETILTNWLSNQLKFTFSSSFSLLAPTIAKLVQKIPNKLTSSFVEKMAGD